MPIHDPEVRLAFFKEVGQQSDFQAVLEHDFIGSNSRAQRVDERRAKEIPTEAIKRPAMRVATAILMYSFGGLRREAARKPGNLPRASRRPTCFRFASGRTLTARPSSRA